MVRRFISRPVLSIVISLIIVLLGVLALTQLPMTQFPNIAPPQVTVTSQYTGANAETCVKAVVTPLERAINGVPGMLYMTSVSGNDGVSVIQVVFKSGVEPDIAAVNVQNRVSAVLDKLPPEAIRAGIIVEKVQNSFLLYLNLLTNDLERISGKTLYNYTDLNILPEIRRIDGVGFAWIMGSTDYAMRIWLNPIKMTGYNISSQDVITALQQQNIEAAPGKVGESSGKKAQPLQYVLKYKGKFNTPEQYGDIILRSNSDGQILRLKDIAEVEFGSMGYEIISKENGKPSAALVIKQRPGSNAREVIQNIKNKLAELKMNFPPGMDYTFSYDVSAFLNASVHEVLKTLFEAFILVSLVVFVFLQDWRSTVIPVISVPVALIGTLFFMNMLGFSLNLITLFALVLAIGIVVDDAIVVVEAVHAKMQSGMSPKKATEQAMREISGSIVAITLVMSAVFVPVSFLSGPTGVFYREFSLTMAISIVLSGVVALTLIPALCVLILKAHHPHQHHKKNKLELFFDVFNKKYNGLENKYKKLISLIANRKVVTFGALLFFMLSTGFFGKILSSGFIPNEDQGTIYANITTPSGSSLERTEKVVDKIQEVAQRIDGVQSVSTVAGYNTLTDAVGSAYGLNLISLKPWDERKHSDKEIIEILKEKTAFIKDARIEYFTPPPVPGYGEASGFELRLLDKTGKADLIKLQEVSANFIKALNDRPEIVNAFTSYNANFPQIMVNIDYEKAAQKKIIVEDALRTLQILLGSDYVSSFIRFGQMYRVYLQASPEFRAIPDDILKLFVKNTDGEMVPVSAFMSISKVYGAEQITRYNMYLSAMMNGEPAPGYSSGDAINAVKEVAEKTLPTGYSFDWAGPSREQASAGNDSIIIFGICLLFVYLLLSAQYESFLLPIAVILSLPVGICGSFVLLYVMGLENNIYAQIAMIMLIGLLAKNAILIIEFAVQKNIKENKPQFEAVVEAGAQRLRPILMTSFAFIAGLIPLILAHGAGAIGNKTIGSAAAGGMLFGTIFGIVLIPGLYLVFAREKIKKEEKLVSDSNH